MGGHCIVIGLKVKKFFKHKSYYFPVALAELYIYLELVSNLTTIEFIKSFKKLISRREKPNIIYSDNKYHILLMET